MTQLDLDLELDEKLVLDRRKHDFFKYEDFKTEKGYPDHTYTFAICGDLIKLRQGENGLYKLDLSKEHFWFKPTTPRDKTDANHRLREPILMQIGNGYKNDWTTGAHLGSFGFPKWIPAEEMFIKISNFLGWLVDNPPLPDTQTNDGKIKGHGFDLKRSFRPTMKK